MILKPNPCLSMLRLPFAITALRRRFSSGPSLAATHAELKDVEVLFQRYQLHKINDVAKIDELEASKVIPAVMAKQLKEDILIREQAGSTHFGFD